MAREKTFLLANTNFNGNKDLQDENSKLRALISNNFGRRKNNPAKDRKALETYVSLRGYRPGGNGSNQYVQTCQNGTFAKSTLDEIAKELNISKTNLKRALRIERNLTDLQSKFKIIRITLQNRTNNI